MGRNSVSHMLPTLAIFAAFLAFVAFTTAQPDEEQIAVPQQRTLLGVLCPPKGNKVDEALVMGYGKKHTRKPYGRRSPPPKKRSPPKKKRSPPPKKRSPPPKKYSSPPPIYNSPPPKKYRSPPPIYRSPPKYSSPPPKKYSSPPPMTNPTPKGHLVPKYYPGPSGDKNEGYAQATWYTGGEDGGACGTGPDTPLYFAALSQTLYGDSSTCGACYLLECLNSVGTNTCTSNKIVVRATDLCPDVGNPICTIGPHFDLGPKAFEQLGDKRSGVLRIKYKKVPCPKAPNNEAKVRVHFASQYYLSVAFPDSNERVKSCEMKIGSDGAWRPMKDDWGNTFSIGPGSMVGKSLSFRLTGADTGKVIVMPDCLTEADKVKGVKICSPNF